MPRHSISTSFTTGFRRCAIQYSSASGKKIVPPWPQFWNAFMIFGTSSCRLPIAFTVQMFFPFWIWYSTAALANPAENETKRMRKKRNIVILGIKLGEKKFLEEKNFQICNPHLMCPRISGFLALPFYCWILSSEAYY